MLDGFYEIDKNDPDNWWKEEIQNISIEYAKYYIWLTVQNGNSNKKYSSKKLTLTHAQKMLALYYLGLDFRLYFNNLKSANILSKILDLDESNTKDYLTYFDGVNCKVKTTRNQKIVAELFEHRDFKLVHDKIINDLG